MENKKVTGFDYLWCALYACAAFAIELLLVLIEGKLGLDTKNLTVSQSIIHWIITIILWVAAGFLVIFIGKKTTGFDIWKYREKMKAWQYIAIVVCFAVNIAAKYFDWNGFKVVKEWQSRGPLLFSFQYLYYMAEGFLISLVIVFGQTACEKWFKNEKIPYGGIILGLTWGLMHIFTKGSLIIGLLSAFGGFLFGSAYLLVNKDYRKALPIIALLFIL
ncbi:MAG: hypothetical protein K6E27_09960 [Eubacterium sp.]|nr:hypothetical protein [Eubacterium sp.]